MKPNIRDRAARRSNADMSAETQAKSIEAAIASLAEHGYAGTTMSGIAHRVGVSRAALIYHFQSKNALMAAVINAIYDELETLYRSAAHPSLTPAEQVLAIFEASYRHTGSVGQMAQIELLLAARRDPEFRAEVAPAIEARDRAFQAYWRALVDRLGGNPERLNLLRDFAVSVFRGITICRSLGNDTVSFERQNTLLRMLLLDALIERS